MHKNSHSRIQAETIATEPGGRISRDALIVSREFLKSLGQSAKLISLYAPEHPVPGASLQDTHRSLLTALRKSGWEMFDLSLRDGRWLANGTVLAEVSAAPKMLLDFFRAHHIQNLCLKNKTKLHELTTLCEIIAMPDSQREEIVLEEFLERNGVQSIVSDTAEYIREKKKKPSAKRPQPIPNPIPDVPKSPSPATRHPTGGGFGALIKSLVEESVSDPEARAQIYGETVRMVRQSIEQRVTQQTNVLRQENQIVVNQRQRTENVMQTVADGRIVVDNEGNVLMMDKKAEDIFGQKFSEVSGRPLVEMVEGEAKVVAMSQNLDLSGGHEISKNIKIAGDEEAMRVIRGSMAVVQDVEGRVVGTYAVMPHLTKYKEAARMEEEFIAHVTHELKAPLSSICSALEIITKMANNKFTDQEKRFLDISRRNGERLKSMIDEILDFSKMTNGNMHVEPVSTELSTIIEEAVDGLAPWASAKGLRLKASVDAAQAGMVLADHGRVVQVLNNLISNAIKNTPTAGEITVTVTEGTGIREGSVIVGVKDSGAGISIEDQERIFERFMQVPAIGEHRDGVGLGLNIVKFLVGEHQGELWLESEIGEGAAFYFTLPKA